MVHAHGNECWLAAQTPVRELERQGGISLEVGFTNCDVGGPVVRIVFGPEVVPLTIKLIENTKKSLILVTPYFDPWDHLTDSVRRAVQGRGVKAVLILRAGEAKTAERAREFEEMGVKVRFAKKLHAKFYIGDETNAIVSSFNLLKSSAMGSWEMACVFNQKSQPKAMADLVRAVKRLSEVMKADEAVTGNGATIASKASSSGGARRTKTVAKKVKADKTSARKRELRRSLSTSALALCTSSTITQATSSKKSPMSIGASPAFVFLCSIDKLCHVQIVCVLVYSFLSPNSTPTSSPKFL